MICGTQCAYLRIVLHKHKHTNYVVKQDTICFFLLVIVSTSREYKLNPYLYSSFMLWRYACTERPVLLMRTCTGQQIFQVFLVNATQVGQNKSMVSWMSRHPKNKISPLLCRSIKSMLSSFSSSKGLLPLSNKDCPRYMWDHFGSAAVTVT